MATRQSKPLIVIVGPTASGKSALSLDLAEQFNGEIICADSRTVYKGMDIGTAKPTAQEQARIPHHVLDVVTPDQPFNVATFKTLALKAMDDIYSRGKVPFMVGGTGLYIDAVVYDYAFLPPAETETREKLLTLSVIELQDIITKQGLSLPVNSQNPRHLIRTIETNGKVAVKKGMRSSTLMLGMMRDRDELVRRISSRVDIMLESGFLDEVKALKDTYGTEVEALRTPGYLPFIEYLDGLKTLEQAKAEFIHNDLQLAKRQRTWFKRNKNIHWTTSAGEAEKLVTRFLR